MQHNLRQSPAGVSGSGRTKNSVTRGPCKSGHARPAPCSARFTARCLHGAQPSDRPYFTAALALNAAGPTHGDMDLASQQVHEGHDSDICIEQHDVVSKAAAVTEGPALLHALKRAVQLVRTICAANIHSMSGADLGTQTSSTEARPAPTSNSSRHPVKEHHREEGIQHTQPPGMVQSKPLASGRHGVLQGAIPDGTDTEPGPATPGITVDRGVVPAGETQQPGEGGECTTWEGLPCVLESEAGVVNRPQDFGCPEDVDEVLSQIHAEGISPEAGPRE